MQTIGGYEVLDELARGGMGVVYRGRDPRNGGLVAIKLILAGREAGDASLRRFEREAAALSRVRHTNVLAIHGSGFERGAPYLVTDLLTGGTLQERINRQGPLPPTEAAALTAAIARGVALVHANGILHRDLKPENVLLRPGGEPCLADFGLVSELDPARSRLTATGSLLGTPSFMSPEQAKGDWSGLGPHSDVYGLGAILYTALTGAPPASGASLTDILLCAIDTAPPSPSSFGRPIPPAIEAVCMAALAKDPAQRPASANGLSLALEDAIAHAEALPSPRSPLLALAFVALIAVGGMIAALSQVSNARPTPTPTPAPSASVPQHAPHTLTAAERAFQRGQRLTRRGKWKKAIKVLTRALKLEPGHLNALLFRGLSHLRSGDYERAAEDYSLALSLLPADDAERVAAHANRGVAFMRLGKLEMALADHEAAVKLDPNVQNLINRGLVRGDLGNSEGADRDLSAALALAPKSATILRDRGALRLRTMRIHEAHDDLTRALELDPDDLETWILRGHARNAQRRWAASIADYSEALRLDPRNIRALVNRGRTRSLGGDQPGALADLDRAKELAPKSRDVLMAHGNFKATQGDVRGAALAFGELIAAAPGMAQAYYLRANCYLQYGEFAGAEKDLERALKLDPDHAMALGNRGALRERNRDFAGARKDLRRCLDLLPPGSSAARAFQVMLDRIGTQ